jgi:ribonuclease Z
MHSFFQFITTPTADTTGTSLLLHFNNKRYLIGNIAEGTQRASVEQKVRLLKVSEIFLTGTTTWERTGGLIGMILTLADAAASSAQASLADSKKRLLNKLRREGADINEHDVHKQAARDVKDKTRLAVFGGPNLNYTLATARRFVFRKGMPVDVHEFGHEPIEPAAPDSAPTWSDENVQVWALAVSPTAHTQQTPAISASPKKRSHDELEGAYPRSVSPYAAQHAEKQKALMMSKSVVSDMFDSTWRMDALVETPIHDVQLPATLFVRDPHSNHITKYTGPMPGGNQPVPNVKVLVRRPWPGALVESLPPTEPTKVAMSYIFRNHVQRGKFQPQRAKDLDIEMGLKWATLGKGFNVENRKGVVITPEMVLGPSKEGGGAAVVDIPSPDYVEALVSRPEWKSDTIMAGVGAFIWTLGPGVASHPLLRRFIKEMQHMKHVISSPELCSNRLALDSAAAATVRLSQIDPTRYSMPVHDQSHNTTKALESLGDVSELVTIADRGLKIQLEPSIQIQSDEINSILDVEQVKSEMPKDVLDLALKAHEDVKASKQVLDAWADNLPQKDVEITTLGTGSALPSKYRNVSATLVRVPGWGSLLFDAGENTLGQLKRVFAPEVLDEIMRELRVIWISHMHADHHLGTVSVVREWYKTVHDSQPAPVPSPGTDVNFDAAALFQAKHRLSVISESAMLHWLEEYSHADDYGFSRLAPLCITANEPRKNIKSALHWFIKPSSTQAYDGNTTVHEPWAAKVARAHVAPQSLDLQDIQCVLVQHCHGARAVSVTFPSGFKASYSGDCRPSKAFSHIGKGSTVCIHEATFDDELQGDAQAKNHSTTSEALSVALGMDAKACILTHFSQRYQKVPVLEYTEDEGAIQSLDSTGDDMEEDIIGEADDALPVVDTAAPQAGSKVSASPTRGNETINRIKVKAGSDMKVCVAFDYMRVKVGDIAQMEKYTDSLVCLYSEPEPEPEPEENKAEAEPSLDKKVKGGKGGKNAKSQRNN